MALAPGVRLGPYEILALVGAGGMGEVYRAKDTRLDRIVAIKVLPSHLSDNLELNQRFEREARAISSLSHSHICSLHDIGRENGISYLVMEYIEGETLATRLQKGPLSIKELLRYSIEIADALDKAHNHGIVHRDLKPGNIMLTKSGTKLLDFGLAKLQTQPANVSDVSSLPTKERDLTKEGIVLGTVQYMSPEQLQGRPADARTDIFALGAVLYEMATGKRAFEGNSEANLIAAILKEEPKPITQHQPLTPPALERLVKMCLAKDPDDRWQSAHDVAEELKWISEGGALSAATAAAMPHRRIRDRFLWTALVIFLMTILLLTLYIIRNPKGQSAPLKFSVALPPIIKSVDDLALSPDGRGMVFRATNMQGKRSVWLHWFDSLDTQELPGTDNANKAFWSFDGKYIGFQSLEKLQKIASTGGPPQILYDGAPGAEFTWNQQDLILFFDPNSGGISGIKAADASRIAVTRPDRSRKENWHVAPSFLPDGQHFLYMIRSPEAPENRGIYVGSLDGKTKKHLLTDLSSAVYAPPGYLLFIREGNIMAQPFDARNLQLNGEALTVSERIDLYPVFSASTNGILAYTNTKENEQLLLLNREGKTVAAVGQPWDYSHPNLSLDEKRLVLSRFDRAAGNYDLWMVDLLRTAFSRFTVEPTHDHSAIWSPDGSSIVYSSNPGGRTANLYQKPSNGSRSGDLLVSTKNDKEPEDWSSDGKYILYEEYDSQTKVDLWLVPMFGDRKPFPYLQTRFTEAEAQFSPDGKWIAYSSDETGIFEVYVRSFPASAGGKRQISTQGGVQPRWRRDGKELFYLGLDKKIMAVNVIVTGINFETGSPLALFQTNCQISLPSDFAFSGYGGRQYAVTADGQRFIVNSLAGPETAPPITVVLNWPGLLKK